MKLGIFGGSFDPIHRGHMALARALKDAAGLDRVIFVPVGTPSHKRRIHASGTHRAAMIRCAIRRLRWARYDDCELRRRTPAYTYDTLGYFQKRYPRAALFFLVGSDSFASVKSWHRGFGVLSRATFLIGTRQSRRPVRSVRLPERFAGRARVIPTPLVAVSASQVRARCAAGRSVRELVPVGVARYLRAHRLYQHNRRS